MKTIVRPSSGLFFNLRPALLFPVGDPSLVPFQRTAHRLLQAPPQLPQDAPNVSGMIIDLEVLLDQVGHPWTCPQRRFVTQAFGTCQEQLDQPRFVGLIEAGQPSRSARPPQSHVTAFLVLFPPPADGLVAHLQPTTDLAIVEVLVEQLRCLEPAILQCLKVALDTSRVTHAALDAAGPK